MMYKYFCLLCLLLYNSEIICRFGGIIFISKLLREVGLYSDVAQTF